MERISCSSCVTTRIAPYIYRHHIDTHHISVYGITRQGERGRQASEDRLQTKKSLHRAASGLMHGITASYVYVPLPALYLVVSQCPSQCIDSLGVQVVGRLIQDQHL